MNQRERFLACMRFEPVDHVPDHEFGYWTDTLTVWHEQGLPEWVDTNGKADHYFGFERKGGVGGLSVGLQPKLEPQVIEETDRYRILRDADGVLLKQFTDDTSSIPHYLDHLLKTRADWEEHFLPRLQLDRCLPADWEQRKAAWRDRDYPLGISLGSLYGWIRNWMGLEGVSIAIATDPAWVAEMMEQLCLVSCQVAELVADEVELDYCSLWEDMSANHGPLISPRMFREFMTPRYKRMTDILRARGVDVFIVDSDGNINELVEPWLEGGVNCMFPLERNGSSDPRALRARYGRRVLLSGGVDKVEMAKGPAAIDAHLDSLRETVAAGGFIPHCDHRCPPTVSYDNYLHYLARKRELFDIPTPPYGAPTEAA